MGSRDLSGNISVVSTVAPAAYTATVSGGAVDLLHYGSAAVVLSAGAITDGTHAPKVQHSDDGATWEDVPADRIHGALANLAANESQEVGYGGNKRYLRAVVTVTGATSGGTYGAVVVRGHPAFAPVA